MRESSHRTGGPAQFSPAHTPSQRCGFRDRWQLPQGARVTKKQLDAAWQEWQAECRIFAPHLPVPRLVEDWGAAAWEAPWQSPDARAAFVPPVPTSTSLSAQCIATAVTRRGTVRSPFGLLGDSCSFWGWPVGCFFGHLLRNIACPGVHCLACVPVPLPGLRKETSFALALCLACALATYTYLACQGIVQNPVLSSLCAEANWKSLFNFIPCARPRSALVAI